MAQREDGAWREAFAVFYGRHKDYLYGICFNLVNRYKFGFFNEDDVFQSTMEKACLSADTFKAESVASREELNDKVDAWLGGIAENVVFDLIRRKPNLVPLIYEAFEGDGSEVNGDAENPFEVAGQEKLEDNEKIARVREAIEKLSPNEQAVIWVTIQFFQCRENQHTPKRELDEIVNGLGISKANFRKIRERAKNKIRIYLKEKTPKMQPK